jgi:hypothetical protein
MAKYISKFEFACEVFGYDNAINMNNFQIESYYNDWKTTSYSLKLYKNLLKTRG